MAEIVGAVKELETIDDEIKRLKKRMAVLRKRHRELTKHVSGFLDEKKQPGLKYRGVAVTVQEKGRREYKKKADKYSDGIAVLKSYGINHADDALEELLEAMKGAPRIEKTLKLRSYKE
jgi:hypothetical protein